MGKQHSTEKTNRLSLQLLKISVSKPGDAMLESRVEELSELKSTIESPPMWIFQYEGRRQPAPWIAFVNDLVEEKIVGLTSKSISALLFLKVDQRFFVLLFGPSARHFLNFDKVERDFPLDVASKLINPETVNKIESCYLEANSMRIDKQLPMGKSVDIYGLDHSRDHVRKLAGQTTDKQFGDRLHGAQALVVNKSAAMDDIVKLCRKYLKTFNDQSAEKVWDNFLKPVTDSAAIDKLNQSLLSKIKKGETQDFIIGIPDMYDADLVGGFVFSATTDSDVDLDLNFSTYLQRHRTPQHLTIDYLKQDRVLAKSADDGSTLYRWPVWDCLQVEIRQAKDTHFLHEGQWHKIPSSEIDSINKTIDAIQVANLDLPFAAEGEIEGDYNSRTATEKSLILMDKDLARGDGYEEGVEVCDLLSIEKGAFIHIKRGTNSCLLSHLFKQGMNSARMLNTEDSFQEKVATIVKKTAGDIAAKKLLTANQQHTVVYAIITKKTGAWSEILPFFSKITLIESARELRAMKYKVQLQKIELRAGHAKVKLRKSGAF